MAVLALKLVQAGAKVYWAQGATPLSLRPLRLEPDQWSWIQESISDASDLWSERLGSWERVFRLARSGPDPLALTHDFWVDRELCFQALERECRRQHVEFVDSLPEGLLQIVDENPESSTSLKGIELVFQGPRPRPAHRLEIKEGVTWIFEPGGTDLWVLTLIAKDPLRVNSALSALEREPLGRLQAQFLMMGPRPPRARRFSQALFAARVPPPFCIPSGQSWGCLNSLDNRVDSRAIHQGDRLIRALRSGRVSRSRFVQREALALRAAKPFSWATQMAHHQRVPPELSLWALGFVVQPLRRVLESPV